MNQQQVFIQSLLDEKEKHLKCIRLINELLETYGQKEKEVKDIVFITNEKRVLRPMHRVERKPKPKTPHEQVAEQRKYVFELIVKYNKSFTIKEMQEFYKKENGTTSEKENNFVMNSITKFNNEGLLRRYKLDSINRYGLVEWFQSGTLIKEKYR